MGRKDSNGRAFALPPPTEVLDNRAYLPYNKAKMKE